MTDNYYFKYKYYSKYKCSDSWQTPPDFYDKLNHEFDFDFDPCPLNDNWVVDGLKIDWGKRVFVNPPYSDIGSWLVKAREEIFKNSDLIVFLLPVWTDSSWFHDYIYKKCFEIRFIRGLIPFGLNGVFSVPFPKFPVMLVIFKKEGLN